MSSDCELFTQGCGLCALDPDEDRLAFIKMMDRRKQTSFNKDDFTIKFKFDRDFTVAVVQTQVGEFVGVSKRRAGDVWDPRKGMRLALSRAADNLSFELDMSRYYDGLTDIDPDEEWETPPPCDSDGIPAEPIKVVCDCGGDCADRFVDEEIPF